MFEVTENVIPVMHLFRRKLARILPFTLNNIFYSLEDIENGLDLKTCVDCIYGNHKFV